MSSRMSGANSAYPPDRAAKSGRCAVALAELTLWFLLLIVQGKETEAFPLRKGKRPSPIVWRAVCSEAII